MNALMDLQIHKSYKLYVNFGTHNKKIIKKIIYYVIDVD